MGIVLGSLFCFFPYCTLSIYCSIVGDKGLVQDKGGWLLRALYYRSRLGRVRYEYE